MISLVPEILWRCSFSDMLWGQLWMCEHYFCCWLCIQSSNRLLRLLQWSWLAVKMGRPDQRHRFSPNICFSMTGSTSLSLHHISEKHQACSLFFIPLVPQLRTSLLILILQGTALFFSQPDVSMWIKIVQDYLQKSTLLTAAAGHKLRWWMGLLTSLLINLPLHIKITL